MTYIYIYTGTPFGLRSSQRSIRVARRGHDIDYSNKCFPSSLEVDTHAQIMDALQSATALIMWKLKVSKQSSMGIGSSHTHFNLRRLFFFVLMKNNELIMD